MSKSLRELASLVGGDIVGNPDTVVMGAADIVEAAEGDIVFAETPKLLADAKVSRAAAIIAHKGDTDSEKPLLLVDVPRYAFAQVLEVFAPSKSREEGVHPTSCVGEGVSIGENPSIGYNVFVGKNTVIGDNAWIYPSVYIGDNVRIGDNCIIHPFVSIYDNIDIGDGVIIHSGTVIGSDGFGYIRVGDKHHKIPQIGSIVIGDDVEIGSNVTIDRARTGKTLIGRGTKIDNLVHIAHNVTIGENCIVIAQVGISGSVEIGDRAMLTGQGGVKDHVTIGSDAIVCGRGGVIGDIDPGEFVSGYPASPSP